MSQPSALRASARSALIFGALFTIGRDAGQFVSMLIVVRLLSPEIYGQAALAQTMMAFVAIASSKTLGPYALQARDPDSFDWRTHFTVCTLLNVGAFIATNLVAGAIWLIGGEYRSLAPLVAVSSFTLLFDIIGWIHFTWLQAHHDWRKIRTLLLTGAILANVTCVLLALSGAGVYALILPPPLLAVPIIIDFFVSANAPRSFAWPVEGYGDAAAFGINRAISGVIAGVRGLAEQAALTFFFGFAVLGIYTRSVGLATLISGRVGPAVVQMLYPVLTRASPGSDQFRRFSGLLLQGVAWISIPAAAFLAIKAQPIVALLYGPRWTAVSPLLPLASVVVAIAGMAATGYQILLANLQTKTCLAIDIAAAVSILAVIALTTRHGPGLYLLGQIAQGSAVLAMTCALMLKRKAISSRLLAVCLLPPVASASIGAIFLRLMPDLHGDVPLLVKILLDALLFGAVNAVVLRVIAGQSLGELLDTLPFSKSWRRAFLLDTESAGPINFDR